MGVDELVDPPCPDVFPTRLLTTPSLRAFLEHSRNRGAATLPLYAARIEDLGQGDLVKVDCAACDHVALLTRASLLRIGVSPRAKVLDLQRRVRVPGLWSQGTSRSFDQVGAR
jgi:hypothetical protein